MDPWLIYRAALSGDRALTKPLLSILERRLAGEEGDLLREQTRAAAIAVGDRGNLAALPLLI
ncbi:MAG: hypothetical protein L0Z55_05770, partial [Planctomycetes bacterium]|nr:hypothetical protein [Planctomycetota bacterium]